MAMATATNRSTLAFVSLLSCIVMNLPVVLIRGHQQFPCLYIFGDSLFDNGNNNDLVSKTKVNYPPYGIDYPGEVATGRFSNGKNIPDYLAEFLGFANPIPPNANATDSDGIKGVNYASGAAGILKESGSNIGLTIPFDTQLQNHKERIARLRVLYGNQTVDENLRNCLYSVDLGSNDYINNYFLTGSISRHESTPEQYAEILTQRYSEQLKTLSSLGARTVGVFGILPSGCTPQEIRLHGTNGSACVGFINDAVKLFNNKLKFIVHKLNNDLPGARLCYIDTYSFAPDQGLLDRLGIKTLSTSCCATLNITGLCTTDHDVLCKNRALSAYWDGFHPTEVIAEYIATRGYLALKLCQLSQD